MLGKMSSKHFLTDRLLFIIYFAILEEWTLLRSVGPIYYFDLTGAEGVFPINFEFNLGYRLK